MSKNMTKKLKILSAVFGLIIIALIGRLAYIQLVGFDELSETAHTQQRIKLEGADSRGTIYDRNDREIVGSRKEYVFIFKVSDFKKGAEMILRDLSAAKINSKNKDYVVYTSTEFDREQGEELVSKYGGYILETNRRYSDSQQAVHMLGYINKTDKNGASGVELMCDDELAEFGRKVFTVADAGGNILQGRGLVVTGSSKMSSPEGIYTTLDTDLQKATEKTLKAMKKPGAVVVLESSTGNIIAAASTPTYNPNKIEEYIDSSNNELVNKVTQGEYAPGSVFKIIVLAAALENGMDPASRFYCSGAEEINGQRIGCETGGINGHGDISVEDAFAESCNCAFIQMGQKVGAKKILNMAKKFGFGQNALEDYPGERTGGLMALKNCKGAGIANLSIGQGETLVTPIRVARITDVIANGGVDKGVRILRDSEHENVRVISKKNAAIIQECMGKVMSSGTGSVVGIPVECGGKTGSAQAAGEKEEIVHTWVTGFAPLQDPAYTITVFAEDGQLCSATVLPVFAQIVEYLSSSRSFRSAFFSMRET